MDASYWSLAARLFADGPSWCIRGAIVASRGSVGARTRRAPTPATTPEFPFSEPESPLSLPDLEPPLSVEAPAVPEPLFESVLLPVVKSACPSPALVMVRVKLSI